MESLVIWCADFLIFKFVRLPSEKRSCPCVRGVTTSILHVCILIGFFPFFLLIPREIAKYAHDHDCYVLTRDSHFYAYSIPGVIDVERVIKTLARNPDPSSIPVFCRHMLDTFGRALSHRSNSVSSEYNIATYPAFPLSLLTKTKDDTLFALYETTRGGEQREE